MSGRTTEGGIDEIAGPPVDTLRTDGRPSSAPLRYRRSPGPKLRAGGPAERRARTGPLFFDEEETEGVAAGHDAGRVSWVGEHGEAVLELCDGAGAPRLRLRVGADGESAIEFLSAEGAVLGGLTADMLTALASNLDAEGAVLDESKGATPEDAPHTG